MATRIGQASGQLTNNQDTFDLTIGGESRTPTGCIVFGTFATTADTNTVDAGLSVGYSDFTNSYCLSVNAEDAQATTDTTLENNTGLVFVMLDPGIHNIDRSLTVAAISGGLRFTPQQGSGSGTQYQIFAIIIFEAECVALNTTDSQIALGNEFDFAHGLSAEPNFGWVGYADGSDFGSGTNQAKISLGVFSNISDTIVQKSVSTNYQFNVANGEAHGHISTSKVMFTVNTSAGTEAISGEITGIDTTNWSITARSANINHPVLGLLVYASDLTPEVLSVDSPTTAASDWNFNGASITAQQVTLLMTMMTAEDTANTDSSNAGAIGVYATDGSDDFSACMSDEKSADPSDCNSRTSTDLHLLAHDASTAFEMTSFVFTSDGWDVASANITTADGSTRKWIALALSTPAVAGTRLKGPLGSILQGPFGGPI